ncbi:uncharacterized protein [Temnothorax nylanderi]|uniref:uncharacterized protein n=1 Tax=Temnothorax nylanderi TaxID=102681 RepID=UPI003A881FFF
MQNKRNTRKRYLIEGDDAITASQKSRLKRWARTRNQNENVADKHCEEAEHNNNINNINISSERTILTDDDVIEEVKICDKSESFNSLQECSSSNEEYFSSLDSKTTATNILEFLSISDNLQTIITPIKTNCAELMLMILQFSNTYMLPLTAISNLISLINNIFVSPILPESRYLIDKLFNFENKAQFHTICPNCNNYLGKKTEIGNEVYCNMCASSINVSNLSSSNFFVILDPAKEISNLIESHKDYYNYIVHERLNETGEIKDIYDGYCYKKFVNNLSEHERNRYVTAVFNTDGAPRFESSQDSIWPIQIQINELPPQFRLKNMITCGMWFVGVYILENGMTDA